MSTYLFDGIENHFLPDGIEKIRFANNCYKTENGFIAKTVGGNEIKLTNCRCGTQTINNMSRDEKK